MPIRVIGNVSRRARPTASIEPHVMAIIHQHLANVRRSARAFNQGTMQPVSRLKAGSLRQPRRPRSDAQIPRRDESRVMVEPSVVIGRRCGMVPGTEWGISGALWSGLLSPVSSEVSS